MICIAVCAWMCASCEKATDDHSSVPALVGVVHVFPSAEVVTYPLDPTATYFPFPYAIEPVEPPIEKPEEPTTPPLTCIQSN